MFCSFSNSKFTFKAKTSPNNNVLISVQFFGELEICHLNPDTLDTDDNSKKFEVFHFFGTWISGVSSGGCGNDGHSKLK